MCVLCVLFVLVVRRMEKEYAARSGTNVPTRRLKSDGGDKSKGARKGAGGDGTAGGSSRSNTYVFVLLYGGNKDTFSLGKGFPPFT